MNLSGWALSEDLSNAARVAVVALSVVAVGLLVMELRSRRRIGIATFVTGLSSVSLFAFAVLRPVTVATRGNVVGPRVVVLVDQSRRLLLKANGETRRARARQAVEKLTSHLRDARISVLGFGEGEPKIVQNGAFDADLSPNGESDLVAALEHIATSPGERPRSVVIVSDGRLSRPAGGATPKALGRELGGLGIPLHTVRLAETAPRDASIRSVRAAGAAVAHQPLAIVVEIACTGGLSCDEIPVVVKELRYDVEAAELASGVAKIRDGTGKVELEIILERAGTRVIEVTIDGPSDDEVQENNTRFLPFDVAKERIRLLHLAGRPTYDVRALRMWLKSDESVDVVAFFILRGETDSPEATDQELALIEFPVTELFTTHLPSFDAIILQDIDAIKYKLAGYLERVAHYVEAGGGLIMVGGPSSFAGGNYAGTALDWVLPVEPTREREAFDTEEFVPRYTEAGRSAPITQSLRALVGEELPSMPGANYLGPVRRGAIALWEHPNKSAGDGPMPLLAMGEAGDGRAIALAVDATHRLAFSEFAAAAAGRAYGALWDGLLGWLMRDPRYEAARVELSKPCIAGQPTALRVTRLPGMEGPVRVSLERLGAKRPKAIELRAEQKTGTPVDLPVDGLDAGGYSARVRIGAAPATRQDFACEKAGAAWSDSRPDPDRLAVISEATGGESVRYDDVGSLPQPDSTRIAAERRVSPILPPWVWTCAAAALLGAHWVSRRRDGLA